MLLDKVKTELELLKKSCPDATIVDAIEILKKRCPECGIHDMVCEHYLKPGNSEADARERFEAQSKRKQSWDRLAAPR